jgi:L-fuconolactonase
MIDSHHHFWNYTADEFGWVTDEMAILQHDFLPGQLEKAAAGMGIKGAISVQARRSLEETNWLLWIAARTPLIKGVVGWVPLKDSSVGDLLDRLAGNPLFCGVREILQGAPDKEYFDCPDFNRGIRELTLRDIPYDLLIFHHQLGRATQFVDTHPDQRFILDHIAKPEIRKVWSGDWARNLRELARRPNVFCKLSGVATEVREPFWDVGFIRPYFETALEAFGATRLMFGSDWPVCLLRTEYSRWVSAVQELAAPLSADEREELFCGAARTAYHLPVF